MIRPMVLIVATLFSLASSGLLAQTTVVAPSAAAPTSAAQSYGPKSAPLPGIDTVLDARAKGIASRLRCPVCQGESIQDSPAELAAQMKTVVREQLANGKSEPEILDYFTQKYGQWILLEPKAEGLNLIVYWLPVLFIVFGGAGLWFVVRRWTRPRTSPESQ